MTWAQNLEQAAPERFISPQFVAAGEIGTALQKAEKAGLLPIVVSPPGPGQRGRLALAIEGAVEDVLSRRGASSPGVGASSRLDSSLSDQVYRARLVGYSGLALGFPSLEGIANLAGSLDSEDSAVLRWWIAATQERPVRLYLSRRDRFLGIYGPPVSLLSVVGAAAAPSAQTPPPPAPEMAASVAAMELSSTPPEVTSETASDHDEQDVDPAALGTIEGGPGDQAPPDDAETGGPAAVATDDQAPAIECDSEAPLSAADAVGPIFQPEDATASEDVADSEINTEASENHAADPSDAAESATDREGSCEMDVASADAVEADAVADETNDADTTIDDENASAGDDHAGESSASPATSPTAAAMAAMLNDEDGALAPEPETGTPPASGSERPAPLAPAQRTFDDVLDELLQTAAHSSRSPGTAIADDPRDRDVAETGATESPLPLDPQPAGGLEATSLDESTADTQSTLDATRTEPLPTTATIHEPEPTTAPPMEPPRPMPLHPDAAEEWPSWVAELDAARGPKPLGFVERMFVSAYAPLQDALALGVADESARPALTTWGASFEKSYTDAFDALRVRGKRPTMVLDIPDIAHRLARLHGARGVQLVLVDGMRYDIGQRMHEHLRRRLEQQAALTERLLLWSALPTTTTTQLNLIGRGPEGLREMAPSSDAHQPVARGRSAAVPRRIKAGHREVMKLDLVEARVAEQNPVTPAVLDAVAAEVAESIAAHFGRLRERTLAVVFGDHGFAIRDGIAQQGGARPEEVLVPAYAWLVGHVH